MQIHEKPLNQSLPLIRLMMTIVVITLSIIDDFSPLVNRQITNN
jgi:hypothetical protein